MIRALRSADAVATLELLRPRPLHNVFLEHVVRAGALGYAPGFFGCLRDDALVGVLMIGPGGSTVLELGSQAASDVAGELADFASRQPERPRHLVGPEDVTTPFAESLARRGTKAVWVRREPVYQVRRGELVAAADGPPSIERARLADLETVVEHSAAQHAEDLDEDRRALDPVAFESRHRSEIRDGRWWLLRSGDEVVFQVHVGPENAETVQIGGVFTHPGHRNRGFATRGVWAIAARLLERRPSVTLFCGEDNAGARRVYERLGFRVVFHYRSYLFDATRGSRSARAAER